VHAAGDLALDQGDERCFVELAATKWRDERRENAAESGSGHACKKP
jgi:hypothetical protein